MGASFQYLRTQSGKAYDVAEESSFLPLGLPPDRYEIHGGVYFAVLEYPLRGKPSTKNLERCTALPRFVPNFVVQVGMGTSLSILELFQLLHILEVLLKFLCLFSLKLDCDS